MREISESMLRCKKSSGDPGKITMLLITLVVRSTKQKDKAFPSATPQARCASVSWKCAQRLTCVERTG